MMERAAGANAAACLDSRRSTIVSPPFFERLEFNGPIIKELIDGERGYFAVFGGFFQRHCMCLMIQEV